MAAPEKVYDWRTQEWVWPDELDRPTLAEIEAELRKRPNERERTDDQR